MTITPNGYFDDIKELFRKTDEKMQETDRELKELGQQLGRLGNRLGEFVEELIKPALVRLFSERGIAVHQIHQEVEARREGIAAEFDLLVVNDEDVIAVEVKSKLSEAHIDEHIERLGKFRRLFPKYSDARLLGAVAAMVISADAAAYAFKCGFFVIGQKGDTAILLNDPAFLPTAF